MNDEAKQPSPERLPKPVDLRAHGIDEAQAAELRARLATFAEDWESPEMDMYDNYDAARTTRWAR
jgi:hypothetical protein